MNYLNIKEIKKRVSGLTKLASEDAYIPDEFENIKFNGFTIKLCGGTTSHSSYSSYNINLIDNFTHFQVVIEENRKIKSGIQDDQAEHKGIYPLNDSRFKNFAWAKYFSYVDSKSRLHHSYIGMLVPIDEVYQLIKEVYKISCLKSFF